MNSFALQRSGSASTTASRFTGQDISNLTNSQVTDKENINVFDKKRDLKLQDKLNTLVQEDKCFESNTSEVVTMLCELNSKETLSSDFVKKYIERFIPVWNTEILKLEKTYDKNTVNPSTKFTIIPIECCSGKHWSLAVLNHTDKTIYHFDSLNLETTRKELSSVLNFYPNLTNSYKTVHVENVPKQEDIFDGGVVMLCLYHYLCQDVNIEQVLGTFSFDKCKISRDFLKQQLMSKLYSQMETEFLSKLHTETGVRLTRADQGIQTETSAEAQLEDGHDMQFSQDAGGCGAEVAIETPTPDIEVEEHNQQVPATEELQETEDIQVDEREPEVNEEEVDQLSNQELDELWDDIEVGDDNRVEEEQPEAQPVEEESEDEWLGSKSIPNHIESTLIENNTDEVDQPQAEEAQVEEAQAEGILTEEAPATPCKASPQKDLSQSSPEPIARSSGSNKANKYKGRKAYKKERVIQPSRSKQ